MSGIVRLVVVFILTLCSFAAMAAEWRTFGPSGGELREVEVSGDTIWVADHGRLYVRRDDGEWRAIRVEIDGKVVSGYTDLAASPVDAAVVAAAGSKLVITTDGGKTWRDALVGKTDVEFSSDGQAAWALVKTCTIDYVEGAGLYRSDDLETWTLVRPGCFYDFTLDPETDSVIYLDLLWTPNGVSRDRGMTWTETGAPHPMELLEDPLSPSVKVAPAYDQVNIVMRTLTDGFTWELLGDGLPINSGARFRGAFSPSETLVVSLADAHAPATLFEFVGGWSIVEAPVPRVTDIESNEKGDRMFVTGEGGIFETSTWPADWAPLDLGFVSTIVTSVATDPTSPDVVYASVEARHDRHEGRLFRSDDGGLSWQSMDLPAEGSFLIAIDGGGRLHALGDIHAGPSESLGIHRFDEMAREWTSIFTGNIRSIKATGSPRRIIAETSSSLIHFAPSGSFEVIPKPTGSIVNDFAIAATDDGEVLLVTGSSVRASTDGGATWSSRLNEPSRSLTVSPSDPSIVYAVTVGGSVYRSLNAGLNWEKRGDIVTSPFFAFAHSRSRVPEVVVHPLDPNMIFVASDPRFGADGWILRSVDGGMSWQPFDEGFIPAEEAIPDLSIDQWGRWLYAATDSGVQQISLRVRRRGVERRDRPAEGLRTPTRELSQGR